MAYARAASERELVRLPLIRQDITARSTRCKPLVETCQTIKHGIQHVHTQESISAAVRTLEGNLLSLPSDNSHALPLGRHQRRTGLGPARSLPLFAPRFLLLATGVGVAVRLVRVSTTGGSRRGLFPVCEGGAVTLRGGEGALGGGIRGVLRGENGSASVACQESSGFT